MSNELAPFIAKEERRNSELDRWFNVQLAAKVHVTGSVDRCVTKELGERRAHIILRVPVWFATWLGLWMFEARQFLRREA